MKLSYIENLLRNQEEYRKLLDERATRLTNAKKHGISGAWKEEPSSSSSTKRKG